MLFHLHPLILDGCPWQCVRKRGVDNEELLYFRGELFNVAELFDIARIFDVAFVARGRDIFFLYS